MDVPSIFSFFTFLFLLIVNVVIAQIPQAYTAQNPCMSKTTCSECIQWPNCAWCFDPEFDSSARCFQPSYPTPPKDQCKEEYIFNPDNIMNVIANATLSRARTQSGSEGQIESGYHVEGSHHETAEGSESKSGQSGSYGGGSGGITQVSPQKLNLKLRARQSYSIQMYYTQAEDYPVDLYYLMDLSKSMEDDKEKLSALGDHLAATMQKVTTNFTLGFGSFVDKVVMPYVSTIPEKLLHPCSGCVAPYGFRNHMPLSTNTNKFSHMVRQASVSGNLDAPEGGFDAIMQAIVCGEEIGWREQARRLLVFSTDAGFHYAGDGKLGGIVKPNDGHCHLNEGGYYTMSSHQDYPSISQINLYVKKNSINVIFAVTADKIGIYEKLQTHIEGASSGQLSNDSSNIVELIKEQYEQISSTVEMNHNASSDDISIKFYTRCLNDKDSPLVETKKCGNVKVGNLIEFKIELEVLKCPRDPKDWFQTIKIYPVGINESLIIDLEMLCSCDCEQPGDPNYQNNAICHNYGVYRCGICECFPGSYGRFCECQTNQIVSNNTDFNCISPKNNLECSGRGICTCGVCECQTRINEDEKIWGKHCECDNFSCERHNGKICSDNGVCECGQCQCNPGWTGTNCACSTSINTCYASGIPDGGPPCSGHGDCICGECKCNTTTEIRYSGRFCENCPTCGDRCKDLKDCVECQQYKIFTNYDEKECAEKCDFVPITVDSVELNEDNHEVFCSFTDEEDCRYNFVYYVVENNKTIVRAQRERECPPKVFLLGVILGVIAAVVLMGLAILLLWKLLTTIHDRREFAKFEKERMMAKWDTGENPIYKQATSTFKNPTYAGKS